jgi:hypothetical protein
MPCLSEGHPRDAAEGGTILGGLQSHRYGRFWP